MLPLTTADLLTHAIVGSVLENLDMERLVREVGQAVSQRILGNNESVDDVARELHERLLLRNESTKKVVIESIYRDAEEAKHNVNVYMQSPTLADARPHLKRVRVLIVASGIAADNEASGSWNALHRQISSCADGLLTEFILRIALCPTLGEDCTCQARLSSIITPSQSRHGLQSVRRITDRERVRHRSSVYALLACGRQGGVWRHAKQWTFSNYR